MSSALHLQLVLYTIHRQEGHLLILIYLSVAQVRLIWSFAIPSFAKCRDNKSADISRSWILIIVDTYMQGQARTRLRSRTTGTPGPCIR
ncbi:hypothetical protein F5B18DRAFT_616755 [Nemania serpens]|nr:hypothetical protein F5B18DRAFT_616755 [Nemania serpens]